MLYEGENKNRIIVRKLTNKTWEKFSATQENKNVRSESWDWRRISYDMHFLEPISWDLLIVWSMELELLRPEAHPTEQKKIVVHQKTKKSRLHRCSWCESANDQSLEFWKLEIQSLMLFETWCTRRKSLGAKSSLFLSVLCLVLSLSLWIFWVKCDLDTYHEDSLNILC